MHPVDKLNVLVPSNHIIQCLLRRKCLNNNQICHCAYILQQWNLRNYRSITKVIFLSYRCRQCYPFSYNQSSCGSTTRPVHVIAEVVPAAHNLSFDDILIDHLYDLYIVVISFCSASLVELL